MKLKIIFLAICCTICSLKAQNASVSGTALIDYYINKENLKKADSVLNTQIRSFQNNLQFDSLCKFPYYIGKVHLLKNYSPEQAEKKVIQFIDSLQQKTKNPRTLYKTYLKLYDFYIDTGNNDKCLTASLTAYKYAKTLTDITAEELGKIHYIIGGNYYALYDLSKALNYFKNSAKAYEKSKIVEKHILADSYNGIAISMWTLNKLDSAQAYFNKAIKATQQSSLTSFKRIYYINSFKFNMALVIDDKGNINEAIQVKKEIIKDLRYIIANSNDNELIIKSKRLLASSISNLAAFYHNIGFLNKAYDMLLYAYDMKKEVFDNNSPRLVIALNQIALSEIELNEFEKGLKTTDKALKTLEGIPGDYFSIKAEILYLKAKANAQIKDSTNALKLYRDSHITYQKAYPKNYSREYLAMLRDYTVFLSAFDKYNEAISIATDTYSYVEQNAGKESIRLLKEIENISDIHFKNKDYGNALLWAKKGKNLLNKNLKNANSTIDSVQIEFRTPILTLRTNKSLYYLTQNKDEAFLNSLVSSLKGAIKILEKRKTTITDKSDINILFSENRQISEFSKQLNLELYKLTNNPVYLNNIIELHESSIYYRIRSRLNIKREAAFYKIPTSIVGREQMLKNQLSKSLNNSKDIDLYFDSSKQWQQFLDSIKTIYPNYYKMRYASLTESVDDIALKIPENTTVIRYMFINKKLYALVLNRQTIKIHSLHPNNLYAEINTLQNKENLISNNLTARLHKLYKKLWLPIKKDISTSKVIVIPDRELFNLNFEMLISDPKNISYLLNKYTFSYNYSLLLIDKSKKSIVYNNNVIAFAPEFNDEMKQNYKVAIKDTVDLDKSYLTLLPQPFAKDLANTSSKLFNGTSFLNEKSTEQIFIKNAKEHKIIHIGTHAESNNVTPELSRLIFAKNIKNDSVNNDNNLYAFEIYNCNLTSNLMVLTACETGKPTYQSGEGMISLAHAFNYAGSESILTSLWKVDEQSSSKIVALFYNYLSEGFTKDVALQKAKLLYLKKAEGRTKSPLYWAGLVLIGDTSVVNIDKAVNPNYKLLILGMLLSMLLILAFIKYIRKTNSLV